MAHYDYGFRIYNPAIGKFLSVDPLTKDYAMLTPYQFASNSPTWAVDLDGLEALTKQELQILLKDKKPKAGDEFTVVIPPSIHGENSVKRPLLQIFPGRVENHRNQTSIRKVEIDGNIIIVYDQFSPIAANMFKAELQQKIDEGHIEMMGYATPGIPIKALTNFLKISSPSTTSGKIIKEFSEQGCEFTDDFARMSDKVNDAAKGVDGLLKAGNTLDKGGFTAAGRALQKHGSRTGSIFPKATGNPAAINAQGEAVLNGILTSPNVTSATRHHARFGNVLEYKIPGGQGARFSGDGKTFIGFLE